MSNIMSEFRELSNYNLFSPFFIIALSFIVVSVVLLIVNTKLKSKVIEIIYCSILVLLLMIVLYFYRGIILSFLDTIVEKILTGLFLPSLLHVVIIVILTTFLLFYVIKFFNKKKWLTITTIVVCGVLLLLEFASLILIANTENIYYVYKNKIALIVMEVSAFLFYFYTLFFIVFRIKYRENRKVKDNNTQVTDEGLEILSFDNESKTTEDGLEILTLD